MKFIKISCLLLLLTGCAAVPVTETHDAGQAYAPAHAGIDNWRFSGRVSLTRGDEGWHAGLTWQENTGVYQLKVLAPLGQGAFQMTGDPSGVMLQTSAGQRLTAADPDSLLAEATGWALPVNGLRYWVRGMPAPGAYAVMKLDDQNRLVHLNQSGWDIKYERYQQVADSYWPAKLRLAAAEVSVRLIIDQWQVDPADPGP